MTESDRLLQLPMFVQGEREQPPYKCECVACANRVTESHIIMSNRTLEQEEIKYLTKMEVLGMSERQEHRKRLNARIAYAAAIE